MSSTEKIGLYAATSAFLVQASCKRLTENEKDEEKLIKETLSGLKESISSNGGKKEVIDMVEDIIIQCKEKLATQKDNTMAISYVSSLSTIGIDTTIAENYTKELITAVEILNDSYEKVRHELK